MKTSLLVLLVLTWPSPAFAQDRVHGLLSLPEVFGNGPCDRFTPREVLLYTAPESEKTFAAIRVDRHWTFPGDGGCEGLAVGVHYSDGRVSELPTEEYQYEAPAAIVLQQRGRWFRLRLSDGTAWVHASERDEFFALEDLVTGTLTTVRTGEWDGRISEAPGGTLVRPPGDPRRHLIGYLEPVEKQVEIVVEPGQDPETIRQRYPGTAMGSVRGRDGRIRLLYFDEGVTVEAFERPDRAAAAVMRFPNNDASELRGPGGTNPPPVFVFDRHPGWFQVAIRSDDFDDWRSERRVWIEDTSAWRFNPVQSDAERERLANESWGPEFHDVRVVESRRVGADLWFHVEFLDHSECRGPDAPTVVRRGWIPAHSRSGEATVWFSSRGC